MDTSKVPEELFRIPVFVGHQDIHNVLADQPILEYGADRRYDAEIYPLNFHRLALKSKSDVLKKMFGTERSVPYIVVFDYCYN